MCATMCKKAPMKEEGWKIQNTLDSAMYESVLRDFPLIRDSDPSSSHTLHV